MPKVYLGARYHSWVNHVDVKTPEKRLARGVPILSREKSTPSMMKHLELRSSENCLASGRAFRTRIIPLELVLNAIVCFHDLSCLIFDFYWFCSIIVSDIVPSGEVVCFHLLHIHWCLYYLDNNFNWAYTADTIDWIVPHFGDIFDFLRPVSPLVLVIVQCLLAMNYDTFARPQLLLSFFAFQVLSCIL